MSMREKTPLAFMNYLQAVFSFYKKANCFYLSYITVNNRRNLFYKLQFKNYKIIGFIIVIIINSETDKYIK